MKMVSAALLLASVAAAAAASSVSDIRVENGLNEADTALVKESPTAMDKLDGMTDDSLPAVCEAETDHLIACFKNSGEANGGEECWNCTMEAASDPNPGSCDGFCADVEQCRMEKCASGLACRDEYYDTLNCVIGEMEASGGCTCSQPKLADKADIKLDTVELTMSDEVFKEEAAEQPSCDIPVKELVTCFHDHEETNGEGCWTECVFDGDEAVLDMEKVEQCRSEKCSSGDACKSEYQDVFACVVEEGRIQESKVNASYEAALDGSMCGIITEELVTCFHDHEETNGEGCWMECVFDGDEAVLDMEKVEQCRSEKCSSGDACKNEYQRVYGCVVEDSLIQESETILENIDESPEVCEEGASETCAPVLK